MFIWPRKPIEVIRKTKNLNKTKEIKKSFHLFYKIELPTNRL